MNNRFMRQGTEYNSKQELGLGLLHWRDHVKAIQARALLNYADGSRGDWKLVLDQWILNKHAAHGRGAILHQRPQEAREDESGLVPPPTILEGGTEKPG